MRDRRIAILRAEQGTKRRILVNMSSGETMSAQVATADSLSTDRVIERDKNQNVTRGGVSGVRSTAVLFFVALVLGWAADFLFYGHRLGISVPLFVALVLGGLVGLSVLKGASPSVRNLWLLAPLLLFSVMVAVRANEFLTFLNVTMTLSVLCLTLFFFAAGRIERLGLIGYPLAMLTVAIRSLFAAGPSAKTATEALARRRSNSAIALSVLRGVIVALPVLILFAALLASADTVFQKLLTDFFGLKAFENLPDFLSHLIFILFVAWILAGGILFAISRGQAQGTGTQRDDLLPGDWRVTPLFGFVEGATILALVNLLFLVFAWIQFANIFFGQPADMPFEEYRDYVRGGFGQLLVVCVLTVGLILGVRLFARVGTPRQTTFLQILSTVMVALTCIMLISAYKRMDAWESVQFYINTQLRIYVRAFIVWLGIVFAWLAVTLWFCRDRFAIGAFAAALGFMVTINLANPDTDVAAYNLRGNDELSIRYLYQLSDDAVPVLIQGFQQATDPIIKATLRQELAQRFAELDRDTDLRNWQSFHFARTQAYTLLSDLNNRGELAPAP